MSNKIKSFLSGLTLKQIILSSVFVLSLILFLILTLWSDQMVDGLIDQQAAARWDTEGKSLGFDNKFTIYDTEDQKTVMKSVCSRLQLDTKIYSERKLLNIISHAKDEYISPHAFNSNS